MSELVLVTGNTDWGQSTEETKALTKALSIYPKGTWLITGGASGADAAAEYHASENGWVVIRVPYISHLGRAGGPARNRVMVRIARAMNNEMTVSVLAFGDGPGTSDCVRQAIDAGLSVIEYKRPGPAGA